MKRARIIKTIGILSIVLAIVFCGIAAFYVIVFRDIEEPLPESEIPDTVRVTEILADRVIHDIAEIPLQRLKVPPLILGERGRRTKYQLVYNSKEKNAARQNILSLQDAFKNQLGVDLPAVDDKTDPAPFEIVIGSKRRKSCKKLMESLEEGEYAIRVVTKDPVQSVQILIAYNGGYARMAALDRFINEYFIDGKLVVPSDLDIRDVCTSEDVLVSPSISRLRDPFVLVDDGTYYLYGTGWQCWKNTSGSLDGPWEPLGRVVEIPPTADANYWAPEVYHYRGKYYMFTTYHSTYSWHRGCSVFCADRPEGPFREISNGIVTPVWRDSIDGTLYIDRDGQPWMVYMQEWTTAYSGVGSVAAAKMSKDLQEFSELPIELFYASDAGWSKGTITDGCWMYRCKTGELLMLWSNGDKDGYAVGIARSKSGTIEGPWVHDDKVLYSKGLTGDYDGGHAMTFVSLDGQMYLAIHSPNNKTDERREKPVFIPIREQSGTLVWDIWKGEDNPLWDLYRNLVILNGLKKG